MNTMYNRIMIIVWRWSTLEGDNVVDTFDTTGEKKDLIIRINELKSPEAINRLYGLIKKHKNAKILLFLHRNHNYTDEDLRTILEKNQRQHCENWLKGFLFTGGTDFIYYTSLSEGLLDGEDSFMNGNYREKYRAENGKMKYGKSQIVSVLSEDEQFVLEQYFENVWIYYEFEFKKKINKLKVDFLSYFVEIPSESNNEKLVNSKEWIARLQQNRKLYLRMRSFLGEYDRNILNSRGLEIRLQHESEIEELQKAEKEDKLSYHLDDCNANLKKTKNKHSNDAYNLLCSNLIPIFIEEEQDVESAVSLVGVQRLFDSVLKTLN